MSNNKCQNKSYIRIGLFFAVLSVSSSCKKMVEVESPIDQIVSKEIYASASSASGVLTGIYYNMSSAGGFATGSSSISVLSGLSADELTLIDVNQELLNRFYKNNLSASATPPGFWTELYTYVFKANAAFEGVSTSNALSEPVKNQLMGEAKFIRALCFFYLVNLYGDIPLIVTTDYKTNSIAGRTPKEEVYDQIVQDLLSAQTLLNENYVQATDVTASSDERIRPNKACATALLARAYLFAGDWINAEIQATALIDNGNYELLTDLNSVFLKDSREAIWQLKPVTEGYNTLDGNFFVLVPELAPVVSLSDQAFNKFSAEDGRKTNWIGTTTIAAVDYHFANKYKVKLNTDLSEYLMVFRLAEQYLIRSEARAQQGNLTEAENDVNRVRNRAFLSDTAVATPEDLLPVIMGERQKELFTEWGHRWLDLKRTNTIDEVMTPVCIQKGSSWSSNWALYPVPEDDLNKAPGLKGNQNLGY